jgi:hypothetical protein
MKPVIFKNLTPLPYLSLTLSYEEREAEKLLLSWKGDFKASPRVGERFGEGFIYTLKTFKTSSK